MRVEVSGQGVLLGFGSARPCTEERFDATEHRTYDGRALAVLRPTGPGKIRLVASAPGCEPAEALVTVERGQSPAVAMPFSVTNIGSPVAATRRSTPSSACG